MRRGNFVLFVLLLQIISFMTDMKTDAMEMYPDGNELNIFRLNNEVIAGIKIYKSTIGDVRIAL